MATVILLAFRRCLALDLSIYARPRLFQSVDITVSIARNPAMVLQLLCRVWHHQG